MGSGRSGALSTPIDVLGTGEHMLYRSRGYERIDITGTQPVLYGNQNGLCFYGEESFAGDTGPVDHVIPLPSSTTMRSGTWYWLKGSCNLEKYACPPPKNYLINLYEPTNTFTNALDLAK